MYYKSTTFIPQSNAENMNDSKSYFYIKAVDTYIQLDTKTQKVIYVSPIDWDVTSSGFEAYEKSYQEDEKFIITKRRFIEMLAEAHKEQIMKCL